MSLRNLSRRLEQLEVRLGAADEQLVIQICYVSGDGSVVDGPQFTVPGAGGRHGGSTWLASCGRPGFAGGQDRSKEDDRQEGSKD